MNLTNENIEVFLNKYINIVDIYYNKNYYNQTIKNMLYLIIPAFVIKYGISNESTILSCFKDLPIIINTDNENNHQVAYFSREIVNANPITINKKIVINNFYRLETTKLLDSLIHEMNHALNSYNNEITIIDDKVILRSGLSENIYQKNNFMETNKNKILEEIINTKQTEEIVDIINTFNNYSLDNITINNTLYSIKKEISNENYKSKGYYYQTYISKLLLSNRTFINTISNLRFKGNINDIEAWFDGITNIPNSFKNLSNLLDEIFKLELQFSNKKRIFNFKNNRIINKIKAKTNKIIEIIKIFDDATLYK